MSRDTYDGDVAYEVWRRGGNPDRIDPDACSDARDRGLTADEYAGQIMRRDRERREQQQYEEQQEMEQAHYEEQERMAQEEAERQAEEGQGEP